jgi:DNA-binding helix-hairpin-helix protein with protein kinase domain
MSQTIYLVNWLESTLYLLGVWDIFEQTASEVVNNEGDDLWTCNITFDIPTRYNQDMHQDIVQKGRQMPNRRATQFYTVLHCLQALERIGYLCLISRTSSYKLYMSIIWTCHKYAKG